MTTASIRPINETNINEYLATINSEFFIGMPVQNFGGSDIVFLKQYLYDGATIVQEVKLTNLTNIVSDVSTLVDSDPSKQIGVINYALDLFMIISTKVS